MAGQWLLGATGLQERATGLEKAAAGKVGGVIIITLESLRRSSRQGWIFLDLFFFFWDFERAFSLDVYTLLSPYSQKSTEGM